MKLTITRLHEICAGHRVYGHETKCAHLHGHNYRFEITCTADDLDPLGRIIDFSVVKSILCEWLERMWDHKLLLWDRDPIVALFAGGEEEHNIVRLPVNPTAENLAAYFGTEVCHVLLAQQPFRVTRVTVWETSKCSATWDEKGGV